MSSRYTNQSHLNQEVGPTVRPLQGLPANKHGSSWRMQQGDDFRTLVDVRSETNDAEMLTVCVGVQPDGPLNLLGSPDLIGRITWGIGGANFEALIDLQGGVTFCIPATYLRVDVAYKGLPPGLGAPTVYQISAGVAYGSYPFNASPTRRTFFTGSIGVGGLVDIPIPAFAVSFTVYFAKPVPIASTLELLLTRGGITTQAYLYNSQSNNANQNEATFPIQNGAVFLEMTNTNAFATHAGVIFNLSI